MIAHASQYSRLTELTKEKEETQSLLDEKMERWMYLTELKEKIDAQYVRGKENIDRQNAVIG